MQNKLAFCFLISFLVASFCFAQKKGQARIDSLVARLPYQKDDTNKVNLLVDILRNHSDNNTEEGLKYEKQAIELAEKLNWKKGIFKVKIHVGRIYWRLGKFDEALKFHFAALKLYQESGDKSIIALSITYIGQDYADAGNYPEAKKYFSKALSIYEEIGDKSMMAHIYGLFAWVYENEGNFAESQKNNYAAMKIQEVIGNKYRVAISMTNIADGYVKLGNYSEALKLYLKCTKPLDHGDDKINLCLNYIHVSAVYLHLVDYSEALKNSNIALDIATKIKDKFSIAASYSGVGDVYDRQRKYTDALNNYLSSAENYKAVSNKQELAGVYNKIGICYILLHKYAEARKYFDDELALSKELDSKVVIGDYYGGVELLDSATGNWKNAYYNYNQYIVTHDSIFNQESTKKIVQQQMQFDFDKKQVTDSLAFAQEKAIGAIKLQKQKTLALGGLLGIAVTIILLFFAYRNYHKQRIANIKLKDTQEQLIRSEKMAALGVLASRVSHEIQNPLNFVNNFSDLSQDLVEDVIASLNEEEKKQNEEMLLDNLEKISEHGKRAAIIVNQLLEHTAKGTAHVFFEEKIV